MTALIRFTLALLLLIGLAVWIAWPGGGRHEEPGEVTTTALPSAIVEARSARQRQALYGPGAPGRPGDKQILFGDLHVHTTFSTDAFFRSLPLLAGEGAHPPADACDFARFCSDLDFWSINDHAETVTPRHWRETVESIRQCNAVHGDGGDPDVVAFLGWEWTQVGRTPEDHYGHKNVVLRGTGDDEIPTRPISARGGVAGIVLAQALPPRVRIGMPLVDFRNRQRYYDFWRFLDDVMETPTCAEGVDVHDLPDDCIESAETPDLLFEKLRQWDLDSIVIPHGNTWGFYTPPGSSWDKQLSGAMHDPARQTLIEVYSGHGNSEEYRDWRAVEFDTTGAAVCPQPSEDYLPCCWQAGELIRERCEDDLPDGECERRVELARQSYAALGVAGHNAVPGASVEDWKGCGQCPDCFNPAFNYRPGGSSQYAMALTNFDDPANPRRFHFGFMASSDNHSARPGTGYKEYERRRMSEATGPRDAAWRRRFAGEPQPLTSQPFVADAASFDLASVPGGVLRLTESERQASFFMTGGLVATHATARNRHAIWDAFERREVYGTSGDRILLWFDLLNGPSGSQPMGSDASLAWNPRFRVRAVGAFEQLPGCPDHSGQALTPERLELLCRGECYHPGDRRRRITRVEVIRIRPQIRPGEPVEPLVDDPWRIFECVSGAVGCTVEFEDADFLGSGRPALYYARAVQEPTPAVNAANLRCTLDEAGNCVEVDPCYGDYRTPLDEDCLSMNEERAWSSPIWVNTSD